MIAVDAFDDIGLNRMQENRLFSLGGEDISQGGTYGPCANDGNFFRLIFHEVYC